MGQSDDIAPSRLAGRNRLWRNAALLCAVASVGFHIYVTAGGLLPNLISRPLHLALAIPWIFFLGVGDRSVAGRLWAALLGAVGIAACLWVAVNWRDLADQYGVIRGWFQYAVAIVLLLIVLDMARRAVQPVMPAIAFIVLLYGLFGEYLPGEWGHDGKPYDYILGTLTIAEGGLWGPLTATSMELVAPFLILGAFVAAGEAGTGFMALSTQVAGRYRAGSAKVEVVASALYGTISGSASANVASTGTFTIPAMIKHGYPPSFAAATEAVASTGGQIMPPVMGAGVFLMAELLRVPYADLMVAAVLPSLLFFVTCWLGVDNYAVRLGLRGMRPEELPGWKLVARSLPFFLGPLGTLIWLFVATPYTPQFCAAIATAVALALLLVDANYRFRAGLKLARMQQALLEAAQQIANIAAVLICASIIVGVFHMSGLGIKFTSLIVGLSGSNIWIALLFTAIACIALGMELPTTAAYVICISVAGPALTKMGLPPLQAHMFVFWYALLCTITPPVCGNVFIAARIANTPWLPVAWRAMRLGAGLFIVPLGFVSHPSLLMLAQTPLLAVAATLKIGVAMLLFSYAAIGYGDDGLRRAAALVGATALLFAYGF